MMRNLLQFLILTLFGTLQFFSFTLANSQVKCKNSTSNSDIARLTSYIKNDLYDKSGNFRNCQNITSVFIYIIAQALTFDDTTSNLKFNGYLMTSWKDKNLKWDVKSWGISFVPIHTGSIWTPDITVLSPGNEHNYQFGRGDRRCELYWQGKVRCDSPLHREIRCQTDYKLWPYDRQNCTLIITTWASSSQEIRFWYTKQMSIMNTFRSNGEWNYSVSRVYVGERKSNYYENISSPQLSVDFVLDRMQSHFRGRFVAPAIIMMIMTLITLWLDPKSIERLAIASLNIIIHLMSIQDLHWTLPHNGDTVPNLLRFYAYSFVLATVALLLTILLGKIKVTKASTPKWISSSTASILRSKVGQVLLLGMLDPKATAGIEVDTGDTQDLLNSEPKESAWQYVTIIFGWISFMSFSLAYFVMYVVLIPSSAPKPPIDPLTPLDNANHQFGVIE